MKMNDVKFSILLPTKDRLELLKCAVKSVLMQKYTNWEIVISDNCSDANVEAWIGSLQEPRIKYYRQQIPLSVTENWNMANQYADGDYKIMLGDDDALLPDALQLLYKKILKYDYPEVIVFPAFLYLQPKVDPICINGDVFRTWPIPEHEERLVDRVERQELVRASCQFECVFGYNMQYYCYSNTIERRIEGFGEMYEPPYPDYYTASMMLYLADSVLYIQDDIMVIGVTPKSYGYYYRNNIEKEGMKFHKESDYREYVPAFAKGKLCSVDEMHTAAMATFALLDERIEGLNVNFYNYYKTVITNEAKYCDEDELVHLIETEIMPNLSGLEKSGIMQYTREVRKKPNQVIGVRAVSFDNILEFIQHYTELKEQIKEGYSLIDIYKWVDSLDINKVSSLMGEKPIFIWGAYERGKIIVEELEQRFKKIDGFLDTDENKKQYNGYVVEQPEYALKLNSAVIVVSHKNIYRSVEEKLKDAGFNRLDQYIYIK